MSIRMKNGKYQYLAQNTILLVMSQFGSKFLAFFLVPLYTSVLTTEEYGIADVVTTSVTLLIYVCTLYIGSAVLRYTLENKKRAKYVFKFALQVLVIGSIIVALGLVIIYLSNLLKISRYVLIFVLGLFIAEALEGILYQYLRGIDKVSIMAVASFISTLARLCLTLITLLVLKWGLKGYLFSMTVGPLVASIFSLFFCKIDEQEYIDKNTENKLKKEMILFSIPTAISQLGWWVNNCIDRYLVIWIKGVALNGIYAMSYKIPSIMSMICNIFCQAWGISAIKEFDKEDKDNFFGNIYNFYNAGLCIVCSMIIVSNVLVSKILFQKDFFSAWKYASLLIVAMLFSGLASFFGGVFNAVKKNSVLAVSTVISALINIIFNILLIPKFGAMGAAIATVLSYYTCWLIRLFFVKRYIDVKINIIKDHIVYILLFAQIYFEHLSNHFYIGQIVILGIIIVLYVKQFYIYIIKIEEKINEIKKVN